MPAVLNALRNPIQAFCEGAGPDMGILLDLDFNFKMLTYVPEIKNGNLIVPTEPDWGAALNEEVIRAHPPKMAM